MSDKLLFYTLCAAIIMLATGVWWNAHTINRLTDLVIQQGKLNREIVGTLSEQGVLNNDQEEFNGKVLKTFGVILR